MARGSSDLPTGRSVGAYRSSAAADRLSATAGAGCSDASAASNSLRLSAAAAAAQASGKGHSNQNSLSCLEFGSQVPAAESHWSRHAHSIGAYYVVLSPGLGSEHVSADEFRTGIESKMCRSDWAYYVFLTCREFPFPGLGSAERHTRVQAARIQPLSFTFSTSFLGLGSSQILVAEVKMCSAFLDRGFPQARHLQHPHGQ